MHALASYMLRPFHSSFAVYMASLLYDTVKPLDMTRIKSGLLDNLGHLDLTCKLVT